MQTGVLVGYDYHLCLTLVLIVKAFPSPSTYPLLVWFIIEHTCISPY